MNELTLDLLLTQDPHPRDFPVYQGYLDHIRNSQNTAKQYLQGGIESRLSDEALANLLALAWHYGHTHEFEQLVALHIDRIEVNRRTSDTSPFLMACRLNALAALDLFLAKGLDLEEPDQNGYTALNVYYKNRVYYWLLEHGANVDCSNKPVWTPLKSASLRGDIEEIERLIVAGASVNRPDEEGRSALWTAANRSRTECVRLLLKAGADPNQGDQDGRVPLMLKINLEIAHLLMQHGADPYRKDNQGRTILEVQAHRPELCQMLAGLAANRTTGERAIT